MDDRKTQPDDPDRVVTSAAASSAPRVSPPSSRTGSPARPLRAPSSASPASPASPASSPPADPSRLSARSAGGRPPDDDIATRLFGFLSTATTQSLSAVGVGLAATTYFVLGRVGLVLMGAFGGIALFVAWEARNPDVTRAVRGEASSDLLARVLEYRRRGAEVSEGATKSERAPTPADLSQDELARGRAFASFRPATRQALDALVDAVVRDYVKWWYQPLVPADQSFPLSCRRVLTSFVVAVSSHLSRKRPADAFLDFLTNSSSIVIVLFAELAAAFAEQAAQAPPPPPPPHQPSSSSSQQAALDTNPTISAADAVYRYLASNPDSNLANLLSQRQQASKFRMVADDLLSFLDRPCYDCEPARLFLREIAATSVLESTLQTCSRPEWINGWIVYLLEGGEPDFSQAIDVGMQTRSDAAAGNGGSNSNSNSHSNNSNPSASASAATHMHHASIDIDGNVGNIALPRSGRSSLDAERADRSRRKEPAAHKKQLSRADEEMEEAMEEMKRMNQMIAEEDARRTSKEQEAKRAASAGEAEARLASAQARNAHELAIQPAPAAPTAAEDDHKAVRENGPPSPGAAAAAASEQVSPKASIRVSGDDRTAQTAGTASTPITPRSSTQDSPSQPSFAKFASTTSTAASSTAGTPAIEPSAQFTSFDQLVPPAREDDDTTSESDGPAKHHTAPPPLTLHHATLTIHDEPVADKGRIKSRPAWDFLIQIEPANAHYPGWMIVRKYADFEKLHEVLRRIAAISGATAFTEQHGVLPNWKVHTRGSLRGELERYVRDACWYPSLAESEGMKRFLEKDTNNMPAGAKSGLQAFEAMGKNMLDVLSSAPKGMAEGSKVVVGGVTGVFGTFGNLGTNMGLGGGGLGGGSGGGSGSGQKKHATSNSLAYVAGSPGSPSTTAATSPPASVLQDVTAYTNRLSVSTPPRTDGGAVGAGTRRPRDSMDSQRSSAVAAQPGRVLSPERRMSSQSQSSLMGLAYGEGEGGDGVQGGAGGRGRADNTWDYAPIGSSNRGSQHNSRASSSAGYPRSPSSTSLSGARLQAAAALPGDSMEDLTGAGGPSPMTSPVRLGSSSSWPNGTAGATTTPGATSGPPRPLQRVATSGTTIAKQFSPLTEGETRVAVELLFAVINELYTLSSAWNIRRTLLTAAKSFLLRPGNPSLASIQGLLQKTVLDANTTDAGMAEYLRRLRENSLPTDAERAAWPAEMTAEEKEKLRVKARRLLIRSGVPAALMGVMGQSATSDALGRIFDCLQIEEVARGLMFGLMLQAARIVTH